MKVHLIKKASIEVYVRRNAQSRQSCRIWLGIIKRADWNDPKDIVDTFNSSDILGNGTNRVVFNIGGNKYRLICKYSFGKTNVHLFVKWIGTHDEYTKIYDANRQYDISNY